MSSVGSVSQWILDLKAGDRAAAQPMWERYYRRLVRLARSRLRAAPRRATDEEDIAVSAFASFFRGAEQGRFPLLEDRDDLWRLLMLLTARKAANQVIHERRKKRGGGKVLAEGNLAEPLDAYPDSAALKVIIGDEPTPEFAVSVTEEYGRLLDALGDPQLRDIAVLKMEGYTDEEVAARLGCVGRTVRRRLQVIRKRWQKEIGP